MIEEGKNYTKIGIIASIIFVLLVACVTVLLVAYGVNDVEFDELCGLLAGQIKTPNLYMGGAMIAFGIALSATKNNPFPAVSSVFGAIAFNVLYMPALHQIA